MSRIGQVGGAGGSGGGAQNAFTIIQPETGTSPTADTATSTLTITADQSITVVGDSTTKKITLNGVAFQGDAGSGGSLGMVPAPAAGDGSTKFLRADGTWQIPTGVSQAVATGWGFSGNAGTNSTIHFVGTADNTTFNVGVSSIFRMTFGQSGPIDVFYPMGMRSAKGVAFYATDNVNAISVVGHSVVAGYTLKLPSAIGTTNQVLALSDPTTGQLAFQTVAASGGQSFALPYGISIGGTGATLTTLNGVAYGTSTQIAYSAAGFTNQVFVGGVGAPGFTNTPTVNNINIGFPNSITGVARFGHAGSANFIQIQGISGQASTTYTLPSADGSANQVLKTDSTGVLAWASVSALGGGQTFAIPWGVTLGGTGNASLTDRGVAVGTSTGFVYTAQGSTNQVLIGGVTNPGWTASPQINSLILGITGVATGSLSFGHLNSNNLITFAAGASSLAQSYTWPTGDGTNGQVLTTNASGGLSWSTVSGGGGGGFSGILGITMGGTGNTLQILNGLAYGTSTGIRYTAQGATWAIPISDGAAPGWTFSPTILGLRLGVANQQTGSFRFAHANSANEITFRGASGMANQTYIFPPADGATFAPLVTNAAGQLSFLALKSNCTFTIDGGGSAITTGVKGYVRVPFNCVITGWDIVADQSGSIVVDVWKDTYANFPPTVADTIAGSEKPTLSSATKNQDLALSTWTTNLTDGDYLGFNVDSVSTVTRVTVTLICTRMG
jgi:hypothetical protein